MALDITQEELRELAILVAPLIKSNATDVGTTPFVDSLDGISSLPAVHRVNGITKIVRAAISKLKGDKGDDGRALEFIIIDSFDTYEELVTAYPEGPERNGFFKVGESLYIWVNGKYEYLNFDVFRSFAKEQFVEIAPAGNDIIITHTKTPYAKVTLSGNPEVFDITINNTKDGSVGKILLSQTGNKRIYFTSFDVIGNVDLPTDAGSIILITYNRVGDKIYIHSDIVLGGSNPTFGKLRNVDQSVDTAPVGSFPVKGEEFWSYVTPVTGEISDIKKMIVPVFNPETKKWLFVPAGYFSSGGDIPADPDFFTISTSYWGGDDGTWGTIQPLGNTKVSKGSSLTVKINANEGYEVSRVNVDATDQGAIAEYTFQNIQDNHTMYAWFRKEIIRYTISVGINPSNIRQCTVTAVGSGVTVTPNEDNSSYLITVEQGGKATVTIVPEDGYQVQQLNVDKAPQGSVSEYTFLDVQADHTMYVWMEEAEIQSGDTDFLTRSDKPGVFYSGIGMCLASLKEDYPGKLTRDVVISCVKKTTEIRSSQYNSEFGIWTAKLENWNKDSRYTLTIDGKNLYTIDCRWLGGFDINGVDNIIIKNLTMRNYCNFSGQDAPEELSAVMVRGSDDAKIKNIVVYNCTFDGYYENDLGYRAFSCNCLRFKKTSNFIVDSCDFQKAGAVVIYTNGAESVEITRNNLQGDYYIEGGGVSHAYVLQLDSYNGVLKLHDNIIDGATMIEYACSFSGFDTIDMCRNTIKNTAGQVFTLPKPVTNFVIESNVFYNNITKGQYVYTRRIMGAADIKNLDIRNNTVYFNGEFSTNQEFISAGIVDKLTNCNNIYINHLANAHAVFVLTGLKEYISYNNLYASAFWDNKPEERFVKFKILDIPQIEGGAEDGYLDFSFETRKLSEYQSRGYETNSVAVSATDKVLNADNGGDYKLLASLKDTYPANMDYMSEFDRDYLKSVARGNIGAYNLDGVVWDESTDTSSGYEGTNIVDLVTFNNSAAYRVPTDDLLLLRVNSKKRGILFKSTFTPETGDAIMRFGQFVSVALYCVSVDGMYVSDNPYTLTIEDNSYESDL